MKLFLQKKGKIFERWGLYPETPNLRRLKASPPDPHWPPVAGASASRPPNTAPPLRISGYAPGGPDTNIFELLMLTHDCAYLSMDSEKSICA